MRSLTIIYIFVLTLTAAGCSTGPDMKEGEWEITTELGMKGIPIKMPSMFYTQCLTKKDLIPRTGEQKEQNCTITDQKAEGDTVSWEAICKDSRTEILSEGSITYSGVLFSGQIDVTISGGPMSMTATNTITGKFLGPCDK